MEPLKTSAVFFDLDGTLLDTLPDLHSAVNAMLSELEEPLRNKEEVGGFVGRGIANLVERCLSEGRDVDALKLEAALPLFTRHYEIANGRQTRIYPDVIETLDCLRRFGIPMACITNKMERYTHALLKSMKMDHYFTCVLGGDSLATRKPDPGPLLHACSVLQVAPHTVLMVGDSLNDAQAARAAGCAVMLVNYGYSEGMPVDKIECDGLLSSFADVLKVLDLRDEQSSTH